MYNPMMGNVNNFNQGMIPVVTANQLPYPANAFVTAPQQPNISNPIFNTALTQDQGIAPYSQMISWALANEIVGRASANPLRIFGYNLYSHNQFNNNEFLELARLVAERVRLSVIRGECTSVEQAIQTLVPDTYTLAAGANLRRFDGLSAFITNQVANDCLGAAQAMDRIYNDIAGMSNVSNQAQMAGMNQNNVPVQNNMVYTNFNQGPTQQPQVNVALASITNKHTNELTAMERQLLQLAQQQSAPVVHETIAPVAQKSPLAGAYRANPTVSTPQPKVLHVGANAPEYNVDRAEFDRQVQQAQAAPTMDSMIELHGSVDNFSRAEIINPPESINVLQVKIEEVGSERKFYFNINNKRYEISAPADYGTVQWKPSALQPFHPLVCLSYQRLTYVKVTDGSVLAIVQELPQGEYHMDYDKHAVNATYAKKPPIVPMTQKPVEKPSFLEVEPAGMTITRSNSMTNFVSVEQAINESYMTSLIPLQTDDSNDAAVIECRVLTPLVGRSESEANLLYNHIVNLTCMKDFASAAEHISSIADVNIRDQLNKFVTDRVNYVVRFELSMAGEPITDFVGDHMGLLSVVNTHYAGAIAESINAYQNRIIRSACSVVKASAVEDAFEYFTDSADNAESILKQTLFVTRDITVTVMKTYSEQLSAYFAKESCAVLENAHPQLREILEQALSVKHIDPKNLSKSYLLTMDGYKFEITKSLTQDTAYLIRRA